MINLGILLREKLAAVLIIPSSWGSQLDSDLHQHTVPHQSPPNPHPGRVLEQSFWFRITVYDGGGTTELYLGKMLNP
jgi:hypothetical protein